MGTKDLRGEPEPTGNASHNERCPRCDARLQIHQPDPELVDRYLATCDECKLWLVRISGEDILVLPPDPDDHSVCESET
jgi:hypothetical protein